jgi:hypothetical protein
MREVDDVLRRRPGLGALAAEAQALQAQLASERGSRSPGAPALTVAELRLLPLLSTHLSLPEIAEQMLLSPTPSSRKRPRSTASWASPPAARRSHAPLSWGCSPGNDRRSSHHDDEIRPRYEVYQPVPTSGRWPSHCA